jgi:hypothetical protein
LNLQPRQLPSSSGPASFGGALVDDDAARDADQDRSQGRVTRSIHDVPDGRGRDPTEPVQDYPQADPTPVVTPAGARMTSETVCFRTSTRKQHGDVHLGIYNFKFREPWTGRDAFRQPGILTR